MTPRWCSPYLGGLRSTRSEAAFYGTDPPPEPEPDPHAIWWARRCAAIKKLAERRERRAALEHTCELVNIS